MSSASNRLHSQLAGFNAGVSGTPWPGPDAERFRHDWKTSHSRSMLAAAAFLQQAAKDLVRNADEQDTASSAGYGPGSGGTRATAGLPPRAPTPADVAGKSAGDVRAWWLALSARQRQEFLHDYPLHAGNTNGIPFADRIEANKANAQNRIGWLRENDPEPELDLFLVALDANYPGRFAAEHEQWETRQAGAAYLQKAVDGKIKLVAYDPGHSSIVEMIGDYGADKTAVVTYVPGTRTNEQSFYGGGPQSVAQWLVGSDPSQGTVALVYKGTEFPDGPFAEAFFDEAKSDEFVAGTAPALRDFQAAVELEKPAGAQTVAVGHSWGLRNVTGSETAGAHYDKVIALSGAAMPPGWTADPDTQYSSYTYPDILLTAELSGVVGDNYPMKEPAFEKHVYAPPGGNTWQEAYSVDNHSLIATTDSFNLPALDDIAKEVYAR